MSITIALVVVVAFSFIVSGLVHRYAARHVTLTGVEHLLVGLAVGPGVANLLSKRGLATLRPFVSTTLGLVGFVIGLPLRHRLQRDTAAVQAGVVIATAAVCTVSAITFGLLVYSGLVPFSGNALWVSLTFGAAAASMASDAIAATARRHRAEGEVCEALRSIAQTGSVVAVAVSGGALAFERASVASDRLAMTQAEWLLAVFGLGVACGVLFRIFVGRESAHEQPERLFLATVGIVLFAAGMAAGIGVSPLLLNAVAGVVVSLLSPQADELHAALARLERPAHVALVIFAGATWQLDTSGVWLVALAYLLFRLLGIRTGAFVAQHIVSGLPQIPRLGNGLLAQGPLAAAIMLAYAQARPEDGRLALAAVLPALLMVDPFGSPVLHSTLADAGQTVRAGGNERTRELASDEGGLSDEERGDEAP